ncbi:MAG: glycosyltransferase [Thermoguttaceae bacterium]
MTLIYVSIAVLATIIVIDIVHYVALWLFLRGFRSQEWKKSEVPFTPKTALLLTLRGADPFLYRCIEGIVNQDYPNYTVFLVVDSPNDPALEIAKNIVANTNCNSNVEFVVVTEHFTTCTLKCNSLVHAIQQLDSSYEIIAELDADVTPHRTWLAELVKPFADSEVVVASGLRWYIPQKNNFGSLVRYLWNAAAIVQQFLYHIPWGGTLAFRRKLIDDNDLICEWSRAFGDDTSIISSVKPNQKIVFVPSLIMENRETISLRAFFHWVERQLLSAKLHHPVWLAVPVQAVLINLPLVASFVMLVIAIFTSNTSAIIINIAALLTYWLGVFGTLPIMEYAIQSKLKERGRNFAELPTNASPNTEDAPVSAKSVTTIGSIIKTLIAVPLTQFVYAAALVGVYRLKKVHWRGVWYEIGADKSVKLIEFKPYVDSQSKSDASESL